MVTAFLIVLLVVEIIAGIMILTGAGNKSGDD